MRSMRKQIEQIRNDPGKVQTNSFVCCNKMDKALPFTCGLFPLDPFLSLLLRREETLVVLLLSVLRTIVHPWRPSPASFAPATGSRAIIWTLTRTYSPGARTLHDPPGVFNGGVVHISERGMNGVRSAIGAMVVLE